MEPKNIITPLQRWLLSQGRCVGCGRPLKKGKRREKNGTVLITCNCQRIFVFDPQADSFRRALFHEI